MDKYKKFYQSIINDEDIDYEEFCDLGFDHEYDEDGLNVARYGVYQNLFKIQNVSFKDFILCLLYGKVNQLFENCFDDKGKYKKGKMVFVCDYAKKLHDEMEYLIPIEGKGIPMTDYNVPGNPINGFDEIKENDSIKVTGNYDDPEEFIKHAMETCILNQKQTNIPWKMALQIIIFQKCTQLKKDKKLKEVDYLTKRMKNILSE